MRIWKSAGIFGAYAPPKKASPGLATHCRITAVHFTQSQRCLLTFPDILFYLLTLYAPNINAVSYKGSPLFSGASPSFPGVSFNSTNFSQRTSCFLVSLKSFCFFRCTPAFLEALLISMVFLMRAPDFSPVPPDKHEAFLVLIPCVRCLHSCSILPVI